VSSPAQTNSQFYVVGGTLRPDAPSYVERKADQELFERVVAGDFCYVLTSRQMGKSSLMARTAKRLSESGVQTAIVDLTQIGTEKKKVSEDRWYYGVAHRILRELEIKIDLEGWWQERKNLPALQRLTEFFSDLVLGKTTGLVTIFIDEIDTTIDLPFTDDFFAAIRACHNARATELEYERLSFVLLGVASPSDLIKDPKRTPFNIGHRIELTDFTLEEANPLAQGLGPNSEQCEQALERVLFWTGGHPYLTQKLCRSVAEGRLEACADKDIDPVVEKQFLSSQASHDDSNLNFVRDWLTQNSEYKGRPLKLYRRIYWGQTVTDDPLSPAQAALKLSGLIVPRKDRELRVRNRIYERVFTDAWARRMMPADWNRRLAAASVALLVIGFGVWYTTFLITALRNANENYPWAAYNGLRLIPGYGGKADELMAEFWERRAIRAEDQRKKDEALLLRLQALTVKPNEIRRSEANRLASADYNHLLITYRQSAVVEAVAFSPDGKTVLTGGEDGTARLWRVDSGQMLGQPLRHKEGPVWAVAFSPDGKTVLTGSQDGTARLWRVDSGQMLGRPIQHGDLVWAVAFSPDGKTVLTGGEDGTARLWRVDSGQMLGQPLRQGDQYLPAARTVDAVAFSPDGKTVLTGGYDGTARLWNVDADQTLGQPLRHGAPVTSVAFSPDGKTVLTGSQDGTARLWRVDSGQMLGRPIQHGDWVNAVAFSPDGKTILTGSRDGMARLWNVDSDQTLGQPLRHGAPVTSVAFSPDGKTVLTGGGNLTARLWRVDGVNIPDALPIQGDPASLLREWQVKLALKFDDQGKIVPMWPVETAKQPSDGGPRR